jgi:hypothetical protein
LVNIIYSYDPTYHRILLSEVHHELLNRNKKSNIIEMCDEYIIYEIILQSCLQLISYIVVLFIFLLYINCTTKQ